MTQSEISALRIYWGGNVSFGNVVTWRFSSISTVKIGLSTIRYLGPSKAGLLYRNQQGCKLYEINEHRRLGLTLKCRLSVVQCQNFWYTWKMNLYDSQITSASRVFYQFNWCYANIHGCEYPAAFRTDDWTYSFVGWKATDERLFRKIVATEIHVCFATRRKEEDICYYPGNLQSILYPATIARSH